MDEQTMLRMAERIATLEYNVNLLSRTVLSMKEIIDNNEKLSKRRTALAYILGTAQ